MSWTERIKATLSGDVAGGDVRALLAASGSLDVLREQLVDRRLAAQIDHIGEEWRVPSAIAPLAMPLWLGDGLVTLARSLCDAEADAHPDRPNSLSAASHDLAVAALRPIETIVAEAVAAAADPARPPWITAAVTVGPRGEVAVFSLPMPIPSGYITGLLLAAERLHGAAGLLLTDLTALLQPSQPPGWLTAGIQHVKGNLAASGARLTMLRTRVNMLVPDPQHFQMGLRNDTLAPLCHDLWEVLNAALVGGQLLTAPRLLPGAYAAPTPAARSAPAGPAEYTRSSSAAPRASSTPTTVTPSRPPPPPPAPPQPVAPPRPPSRVERARDLPDIQTLPTPAEHRRQPVADLDNRASRAPEQKPAALPEIGGVSPASRLPPGKAARSLPEIDVHPRPKEQEAHELPQIGPE